MGLTQQPTKIWEIPEPVPAFAPLVPEPTRQEPVPPEQEPIEVEGEPVEVPA